MSKNVQIVQRFKDCLPKLSKETHKGQSGKVGVVGGSREYTGAPFFAAISSLRTGADLSYVFTTKDAAPIIKGDVKNNEVEIKTWMSRLTSIVIGPGLGRSESAFESFRVALINAKANSLPIVIDADGLFILTYDLSLIKGYKKCILTPNYMEFKRLYEYSFQNEYEEKSLFSTLDLQCKAVKRLAEKLEFVTILKKGDVDIISDGRDVVTNDSEGSLKRCGGIGDLLTGTLGTFLFWTNQVCVNHTTAADQTELNHPSIVAAYAGSVFIKECSRLAFNKFHRSILAVDVIEQIPETFYQMYDS